MCRKRAFFRSIRAHDLSAAARAPESAAERVSVRTTSSPSEGARTAGGRGIPTSAPRDVHGLRGGYTRGAQGTTHTCARNHAWLARWASQKRPCVHSGYSGTAHRSTCWHRRPHTQHTCIQYERLLCERRHLRGCAHDRGIERSGMIGADVRCSVGKWVPLKWVEIVAI